MAGSEPLKRFAELSGVRVLLIEDDPDDHLLTRELLEEIAGEDFELEWARSYEAGLKRLGSGEHDLCLLDYRMGPRSGLDLLRAAREQGVRTPVLVLTGKGDHDIDVEAMRAGAGDYLEKDALDAKLLGRAIRYLLERARTEEALRESERRLRTLIRNLPGVVYRSRNDARWTMEYVGGRSAELLGYPPEALVGEAGVSVAELIHPEDRDRVWSAVQEAVARRRPFQLEYRLRSAAGEERCLWEQGEGIFSAEGKLEALEGFITDVTAIKEAEERERQLLVEKSAREHSEVAQELIEGILESITDAFFAVDEHWRFTYVNSQVEVLTLRSRDELLGYNFWELFPTWPKSRAWKEMHRAVEEQVAVDFEEYEPNTGIWARVRAYPREEGLTVYVRDVTARRRAEAESDLEQRRLGAVLDALPVGVFVADANGKIIRTNAASERIWESEDLPQPEHPGEYGEYKASWPETGERLKPSEWGMARALSGESVDEQEVVIETFRGAKKTILNYARPIVDGAGQQVGAVGAVVDITQRKQAEEALHASEGRFRLMVESVRDYAIILLDPEGRVVRWNAGAERVKGYASEEILGRHISCFYPEEDRERAKPQRMLELAAEHGVAEDEGWRVRRDGSLFWGSVVISAMRNKAGALVGFAKITRDLTERHQAEEALHESRLTMEAILAASPDIIELLDAEGRFRWVSPAVQSVLGYSVNEVEGSPMQDFIAPENREALAADLRQLVAGDTDEVRLRYGARHRDGHWVRMEGHGRAIRSEVLRGLVLVARDVTEQEQLLASLHAAKEEAEAASRAKSEMLSRTSHELRTPMNAIIGFAQLLEMDVQKAEDRESVEQILRAGRHLLSLIDEVLDIARAESGEMTLPAEAVHVGELADEAFSLLRPQARKNEVELPSAFPPACDAHVLADPKRLKQVLLNLLSNAIKYNRAGGRVEVICEDLEQGRLRIKVRDSGPGIPPERLPSLFAPFERAGAERTQVEGTGLGLALSKALAHAMGGEIGAESTPGQGSTFWIELPRVAGSPGEPTRDGG